MAICGKHPRTFDGYVFSLDRDSQPVLYCSLPKLFIMKLGGFAMCAEDRRQAILDMLSSSHRPVSASALASRFSVSRQIIVGDVALLRASGADISATPRGYIILPAATGLRRQVAVQHDAAKIELELNAIVDQGCTVVDVIVEHPLYGQLTGPLQISSRHEVAQFMVRCRQTAAMPLSRLTEGLHLHTLSCPDEEAYRRTCQALRTLGILLEES